MPLILPSVIGARRAEAIYRVVFLLVFAWWLIPLEFSIGIIAALIWMVVDVVLQLLTNDAGWMAGGGGMDDFLERLYYFPVDQAEWTLFGTGSFPWLP